MKAVAAIDATCELCSQAEMQRLPACRFANSMMGGDELDLASDLPLPLCTQSLFLVTLIICTLALLHTPKRPQPAGKSKHSV